MKEGLIKLGFTLLPKHEHKGYESYEMKLPNNIMVYFGLGKLKVIDSTPVVDEICYKGWETMSSDGTTTFGRYEKKSKLVLSPNSATVFEVIPKEGTEVEFIKQIIAQYK